MSPGLILFLLLVAMPIAEVATFIEVGGQIGLWPTIALVITTAAIGTAIIRWQGVGLIAAVQRQMAEGKMPAFEIFSGVCLLVGGALLLTPGFITDTMVATFDTLFVNFNIGDTALCAGDSITISPVFNCEVTHGQ